MIKSGFCENSKQNHPKLVKNFFKHNKAICSLFIASLVIIILYIYSLDKIEWFPHADVWFQVLFQLSIGFLVSFIFYIMQVYIPQKKLTEQANKCIQDRIQNIVDKMEDIFRRIFEKYDGTYNEESLTCEKFLEMLHKIRTLDRINVIAASRSHSGQIDENSYFTIKEWILTRLDFIEHDIDCLFKYYSAYVTPELLNVLEKIIHSTMHKNIARVTLQMPNGISFESCNEDFFLKPYFDLMKELESLKRQFRKY